MGNLNWEAEGVADYPSICRLKQCQMDGCYWTVHGRSTGTSRFALGLSLLWVLRVPDPSVTGLSSGVPSAAGRVGRHRRGKSEELVSPAYRWRWRAHALSRDWGFHNR